MNQTSASRMTRFRKHAGATILRLKGSPFALAIDTFNENDTLGCLDGSIRCERYEAREKSREGAGSPARRVLLSPFLGSFPPPPRTRR